MRLDHLLSKDGRVGAERWMPEGGHVSRGYHAVISCCIAVYKSRIEGNNIPVAIRPGDTPVPIPNTTVKTRTAKSTLLETAREDRRLQDFKKVKRRKAFTYIDMSLTSKASKCSIAFGI